MLPATAGPEERFAGSPELVEALACLDEREREVLALRYGGDLTGAEVAAVLGLSVANVQQISSRSLRRLRTLLQAAEATGAGPRGARPLGSADPPALDHPSL